MRWAAIVGGATAGLWAGGPIGAILGGAAGYAANRLTKQTDGEDLLDDHRLDEVVDMGGTPTRTHSPDKVTFSVATIVLGAKMAKASGTVTRKEVDAFRKVFQVSDEDAPAVARVFDAARADADGYEPHARQIAVMMKDRPAVLEQLLEALLYIAWAEGPPVEREIAYLRDLARLFGFTEDDFDRILAACPATPEADPHKVLGVPANADDDTVRRVYLRLVRDHHPDKLVADGMPVELIDTAARKLAAINVAYDQIKVLRGR